MAQPSAACCLLLPLLLLAGAAAGWPCKKDQSPEAVLWRWVKSQGGNTTGFRIGRACPTCMRSAIATTDIKQGKTLLKIPFSAVLRLKDIEHSAFASEFARDLLDDMHNDPQHNQTWAAFWATQPLQPGTCLTPEVMTDEQLDMLQAEELAALARQQREVAEEVYHGTYTYYDYTPFNDTVPEDRLGLDMFKHVSCLLGSRYFGFYRDGQQEHVSSHLVPLLDFVNHSDDPNAERSDDGKYVLMTAIKDIKKGEEITNNYQPGVIHRPDMSLYIYGFVVEKEQPLLAAVDLPGYAPADPFSQTAFDDTAHDADGEHCSQEEHDRLAARLAAVPTTEEEDKDLLSKATDWRVQAILQFRIMRKRALRQTLGRMEAALAEGRCNSAPPGEASELEVAADEGEWEEVLQMMQEADDEAGGDEELRGDEATDEDGDEEDDVEEWRRDEL